jgi:hypothetical protein
MLLDENHKTREIKYIETWCPDFANEFLKHHEQYFILINFNIFPINTNMKIYQLKGDRFIYTTEERYCPHYLITYKSIPCILINTCVLTYSTIYTFIFDYSDKIPIYNIILNSNLPEIISLNVCFFY